MEDRGGNRIEPAPAVGDVLAAKRSRFLKAAQTAGLFAALTAFGGYLWAASGDAVPFRYVSLWHDCRHNCEHGGADVARDAKGRPRPPYLAQGSADERHDEDKCDGWLVILRSHGKNPPFNIPKAIKYQQARLPNHLNRGRSTSPSAVDRLRP